MFSVKMPTTILHISDPIANLSSYLLIQFSYKQIGFLGIQSGIIVKYYLVDIYSNSVDFINEPFRIFLFPDNHLVSD